MNWLSSAFRIRAPSGSDDRLTARRGGPQESQPDSAISRISKLIPAEVVGAYLTGRSIALANDAIGLWAVICLALTLFLRILLTRDEKASNPWTTVQWDAVIYAMISFAIWIYAMGDNVANLQLGKYHFLASLLAIIWPIVAAQLVLLGRKHS